MVLDLGLRVWGLRKGQFNVDCKRRAAVSVGCKMRPASTESRNLRSLKPQILNLEPCHLKPGNLIPHTGPKFDWVAKLSYCSGGTPLFTKYTQHGN